MIDNIIHNTIYQTNHCRYHVFFTYKYDSYNMTPTSLFHVTSYQKINNDDDNMSLIKYNFFRIQHHAQLKNIIWRWKTNILPILSFSKTGFTI